MVGVDRSGGAKVLENGGAFIPSLVWGPREIFSCAGRTAFFGGMIAVVVFRIFVVVVMKFFWC